MLIQKEPGRVWAVGFLRSVSGSVFALLTKNQYTALDFIFLFPLFPCLLLEYFKNIFIADSLLYLGLKVNIMLHTAPKARLIL